MMKQTRLKQALNEANTASEYMLLWLQAPPANQVEEGNQSAQQQTISRESAARALNRMAGTGTMQWAQHARRHRPAQDAACARSQIPGRRRCGGQGSKKCTSAYSDARVSSIKRACMQGSSKPASPPPHRVGATPGSGLCFSKSIDCTWSLMLVEGGCHSRNTPPCVIAPQRSLKRDPHALLTQHTASRNPAPSPGHAEQARPGGGALLCGMPHCALLGHHGRTVLSVHHTGNAQQIQSGVSVRAAGQGYSQSAM